MATPSRPNNHVIVLFGATGDLAKRKLLPGLFHLAAAGLLPERYRIVGMGRSHGALSTADFRQHAPDAVAEFGTTKPTGSAWRTFADALSFAAADPDDPAPLVAAVQAAEKEIGGQPQRLFHLAIPRRPSGRSSRCSAPPAWPTARASSSRSRSAPTWRRPGP